MPIKHINVKLREIGQIRLGQKMGEKGIPRRLETFRFTSASPTNISTVSKTYGGEPTGWDSPRGAEWEVVTDAAEIDIVLPPHGYLDQWMEMWTASGCQRRCDGEWDSINKEPCVCPEDAEERMKLAAKRRPEACKPTTRLWVILPEVEALGCWKLVTHSFYAAQELQGVANVLAAASAKNAHLPARLRIDHRTIKRDGQTQNFSIPVIDVDVPLAALLDGSHVAQLEQRAMEMGQRSIDRQDAAKALQQPTDPEPSPEPGEPEPQRDARAALASRAKVWHGKLADSSDPRVGTMGATELRAIIDDLGLDAGDVQALLGVALTDGLDGLADAIQDLPGNPTYLYIARRMVQTVVDSESGP